MQYSARVTVIVNVEIIEGLRDLGFRDVKDVIGIFLYY